MMKFADPYRGNGYFWTLKTDEVWICFAIRWKWHFYKITPPGKPNVRRYYFGPFELELNFNR